MSLVDTRHLIKQRDEFASEYDNFYMKTHPYFKDELTKIIEALDLKKEEIIFDAGCGTDLFSQHIAKKGKFLFGFDYSKESANIFNSKGMKNARATIGDLTEPIKTNEKFDKAVSIQVIQHIPTEELRVKALRNIKEVLKDNGILVCELQDWTAWNRRLRRLFSKIPKEEREKDFYIYRFSPDEFIELLKKVGFRNSKLFSKAKGGYFITISRK